MRKTAWFEPLVVTGLCSSLLACLPQQEVSAYSAGTDVNGAPLLEQPPAQQPGSMAAPDVDGEPQAPDAPSDTPANTDGLAQPDQLVPVVPPAEATGSEGSGEPGEDPGREVAEPTPEPAPAPGEEAPAAAPEPAAPPELLPPVVEPAAPAQFRFVRLVADSEFNGGPLSTAAELDVLGADGQALDRTGWVATADSAEPTFFGGAPAALAIDGQAASVWHTAWFQLVAPPAHPHYLQLDMGQPRAVTGFRYLARQDASVGRIAEYRFFVSADGVEWGEPILAGRLQDTAEAQAVRLPAP